MSERDAEPIEPPEGCIETRRITIVRYVNPTTEYHEDMVRIDVHERGGLPLLDMLDMVMWAQSYVRATTGDRDEDR